MNGIEVIKQAMGMASQMALALADDLKEQPMRRACDNGNHALWIMGHLAVSEGQINQNMCGEPNELEHWLDLFRGGTNPSDDASIYPSYDEVVEAFKTQHGKMMAKLDTMTDADLDKPATDVPEERKEYLGLVGQCFLIMAIHPWHHRGQLADIRRGLGRDPMFA